MTYVRYYRQKSYDDTLSLGDKRFLKCAADDPSNVKIIVVKRGWKELNYKAELFALKSKIETCVSLDRLLSVNSKDLHQ